MSHFGDLISGKTKATTVSTPVVKEIADPVSEEKDFSDMSKEELEDYGRTIGIELDRRHNKSKLIKELKDYIESV